jgi:hypothetical protein
MLSLSSLSRQTEEISIHILVSALFIQDKHAYYIRHDKYPRGTLSIMLMDSQSSSVKHSNTGPCKLNLKLLFFNSGTINLRSFVRRRITRPSAVITKEGQQIMCYNIEQRAMFKQL